jgi:D-arabinose 1-dehydrogenase-like Zn-dependent alcohol dehydrogenase
MRIVGERARLLEVGWEKDLVHEVSGEPLPEPTGRDVLVEVAACGVCHRDLIDRAGRFPFLRVPITPGHEAVGRVVAAGPQVADFRVGDRVGTMHRDACGACPACRRGDTTLCEGAAGVFGLLADGGYARHVVAHESAFYPVPEGLADVEAAVMHCTFGTAYRDLVTLGGLAAGERVLVTGANGGVGMAAVQLAARLGAEVVAVVRDGRHRAFLEGLGAHRVVVDPGDGFHKHRDVGRVEVAVDTVGTPTFNAALRSLRTGGRLVVVGNIVAAKAELNLGYIITQGLSVRGGSGATRREMAEVFALQRERPFRVAVHRTLPLARADEAQRLVRAGGLEGRVVLVPDAATASPSGRSAPAG